MTKKWKMFASIATVLIVSLVAGTISYSWIKRRWSPQLWQDNIRIESAGALGFKIDKSGSTEVVTAINLSDFIGGGDIILKPVSNVSGRGTDFFRAARNPENAQLYFEHISTDVESSSMGYVDVHFQMVTAEAASSGNSTQYVFIHPASYLRAAEDEDGETGEGYKAVRFSIAFNSNQPIIFVCDEDLGIGEGSRTITHKAITNKADGNGQYEADGTYYYVQDEDGSATGERSEFCARNGAVPLVSSHDYVGNTNVELHSFSEYWQGVEYDEETGKPEVTDKTAFKPLYTLAAGSKTEVYIRLWLEGEDPLCTTDIAGDMLDLLFKFDAVTEAEADLIPDE